VTGVLADSPALVSSAIGAPSIEYGQLAPMLVVFGAGLTWAAAVIEW